MFTVIHLLDNILMHNAITMRRKGGKAVCANCIVIIQNTFNTEEQFQYSFVSVDTVVLVETREGCVWRRSYRGSILGRAMVSSVVKTARPPTWHTQPPVQWMPKAFSPGKCVRGLKLTAQFHLDRSFKMSGAAPLIPHMALKGNLALLLQFTLTQIRAKNVKCLLVLKKNITSIMILVV
jgi:hypothetical protein